MNDKFWTSQIKYKAATQKTQEINRSKQEYQLKSQELIFYKASTVTYKRSQALKMISNAKRLYMNDLGKINHLKTVSQPLLKQGDVVSPQQQSIHICSPKILHQKEHSSGKRFPIKSYLSQLNSSQSIEKNISLSPPTVRDIYHKPKDNKNINFVQKTDNYQEDMGSSGQWSPAIKKKMSIKKYIFNLHQKQEQMDLTSHYQLKAYYSDRSQIKKPQQDNIQTIMEQYANQKTIRSIESTKRVMDFLKGLIEDFKLFGFEFFPSEEGRDYWLTQKISFLCHKFLAIVSCQNQEKFPSVWEEVSKMYRAKFDQIRQNIYLKFLIVEEQAFDHLLKFRIEKNYISFLKSFLKYTDQFLLRLRLKLRRAKLWKSCIILKFIVHKLLDQDPQPLQWQDHQNENSVEEDGEEDEMEQLSIFKKAQKFFLTTLERPRQI